MIAEKCRVEAGIVFVQEYKVYNCDETGGRCVRE